MADRRAVRDVVTVLTLLGLMADIATFAAMAGAMFILEGMWEPALVYSALAGATAVYLGTAGWDAAKRVTSRG